jgi:hypothetical protein
VGTNEEQGPVGQGTAMEPPPRLPVRASIYIDVDGTVHFGALFEELVPVADSLGGRRDLEEPSRVSAGNQLQSDSTDEEPVPGRRGGGP